MESDFGAEIRECDGNMELTQDRLRNVVATSAEIWNEEARGVYLNLDGPQYLNADDVCNDLRAFGPSVFVEYQKSCHSDWGGCTTTAGYVDDVPLCTNKPLKKMVIFGSQDATDPQVDGTCVNPWVYDFAEAAPPNVPVRSIHNLFTHELGHVIGMYHPDEEETWFGGTGEGSNIVSGVGTNESIMWSAGFPLRMSHLYAWERDCADEMYDGGRHAIARFVGFDSNSVERTGGTISTTITQKGMLTPGYFSSTSSNYYYSLMSPSTTPRLRKSVSVFSDGTIPFTTTTTNWSNNLVESRVSVFNRDPNEVTDTMRLSYLWWNTTFPQDRSYIKFVDTMNEFSSSSVGFFRDKNGVALRSHIPLVRAFDDLFNHSTFAMVDTNRTPQFDMSLPDANQFRSGEIYLFPRYDSGSYERLWTESRILSVHTPPVHPSTSWDYSGATMFAPAIACSEEAWFEGGNLFNCIVAWVDNGTPDNHILYVYFNTANNRINYESGGIRVYNQSHAVGPPSIIAVDGHFRMAYKRSGTEIHTTKTPYSCLDCWSSPALRRPSDLSEPYIDSPSYLYDQNDGEYVLSFTQFPF
jgi:hypothetical protein